MNTSSSTQTNSMIFLDCQERQIGKGQDIAISGRNLLNKNGRHCDWIFVADGHGDDTIINMLRNLIKDDKMLYIISTDEPMDELVLQMKRKPLLRLSGATCIIVKIWEDNVIQCWSVGDSQVAIYVNKQLHYLSCPHNMKNPLEQERLAENIKLGRVRIEKMKDLIPRVATKNTMFPRVGEYIHTGRVKLAMTQALGDDWVTGIVPEKFTYSFDPKDEVRVVAGTDGFWEQYIFEGQDATEDLIDITTLTTENLIIKTNRRWEQNWEYFWNPANTSQSIITNYDGEYDDIALGIWTNRRPIDYTVATIKEEEEKELEKELEDEKMEEKEDKLDDNQQSALNLWQKITNKAVTWLSDGVDLVFDALADKIFEDFANGSNKEDSEYKCKEEEDSDSDPDMPGLIPYYPQMREETIQDKKNRIIRLEQELAEDIIIDNTVCMTSIEIDGQIIDIEALRLSQMESLKLVIKEHIQMLQITEIRERLRYLFNGNEFYKLVKELNLYEQELLMQCDEEHEEECEEEKIVS